MWADLNTAPYLIALITSPFFTAIYMPDSAGYYVGLFVQWFAIGLFLGFLITSFFEPDERISISK